jgi:hypothetical protein
MNGRNRGVRGREGEEKEVEMGKGRRWEKIREKTGDRDREKGQKEREIRVREIDRYRMECISVKYERRKIISLSQR